MSAAATSCQQPMAPALLNAPSKLSQLDSPNSPLFIRSLLKGSSLLPTSNKIQ